MKFSQLLKTLDPWQKLCVYVLDSMYINIDREADFFNAVEKDYKVLELWSGIDKGNSIIYVKLETIKNT